jgi:methyl-accepting chemotaxis protein
MLERWSVARRINGSFICLTLLIIGLSVFSYGAVRQLQASFAETTGATLQKTATSRFMRHMNAATVAATAFGADPSDAMARVVADNIAAILDRFAIADAFDSGSPYLGEIVDLRGLAGDYRTLFAQIVAQRNFADAAQGTTITLTADLQSGLATLGGAVSTSGLPPLVLAAATAQQEAAAAQLRMDSAYATRDADALRAAGDALRTLDTALATLAAAGGGAYTQQQITALRDGLPPLLTGFDTFAQATGTANRLTETELDPLGRLILQRLDQLFAQIQVAEDRNRTASATILDNLRWVILVAGLVSVCLAVLAAVMIGRSITAAIARLAQTTDRLAAGETDVQITGTEHRHELGRMARALEVFRDAQTARHRAAADHAAMQRDQQHVVDTMQHHLACLAQGDLTMQIDQPFAPHYDDLRTNFNRTAGALQAVIGQVATSTALILTTARQSKAATSDLSQRTENQAATLEQTAAALDQLTASVRSAADHARSVGTSVDNARARARTNGDVVVQAVAAMSEIARSSHHIAQVIGVIDDIAFQTNLLALNAGVEAARAGESGRGFAVVAAEVRALAQRSAAAAKEITGLIASSGQHVARGSVLVGDAGAALQEIIVQINDIADMTTRIATSAQEQSTALSEINIGVNQLDQVTQQNAAMVQDTLSRGATLERAADTLTGLIGGFTVGQPEAPALTSDAIRPLEAAIRQTHRTEDYPPFTTSQRRPAPTTPTTTGTWKDF